MCISKIWHQACLNQRNMLSCSYVYEGFCYTSVSCNPIFFEILNFLGYTPGSSKRSCMQGKDTQVIALGFANPPSLWPAPIHYPYPSLSIILFISILFIYFCSAIGRHVLPTGLNYELWSVLCQDSKIFV